MTSGLGAGGLPAGFKHDGDGYVVNSEGERFRIFVLDQEGKEVKGDAADGMVKSATEHVVEQLNRAQRDAGENLRDLTAVRVDEKGISLGDKKIETVKADDHDYLGDISRIAGNQVGELRSPNSELVPLEFSASKLEGATRTTQKKTKSIFREIGKFFTKMQMPKLLIKVGTFFEKKLTPDAYKARMEKQAREFFTGTSKKFDLIAELETFKDYELQDVLSDDQPNDIQSGTFTYVPKALMMTGEERSVRLFDKKIGAEAAAGKENYRKVPEFKAHGLTTTGYVVNAENGRMTSERVVPTSFTKGKPEESNHLMNCYLSVNEAGNKGIMRTGVINTPEKAEEFMVAAQKQAENLHKPTDRRLRIVSHQINSPETEGKMIVNQHQCLAQVERDNGNTQIVHLNMPSNRFYHYTKDYGHLDPKGWFLGGEKKAHEQNIEALPMYLNWIAEDLEALSESATDDSKGALKIAAERLKGEVKEGKSLLDKTLELRNNIQNSLIKIQESQDALKENAATLEKNQEEISKLKKEIAALKEPLVAKDGEVLADDADQKRIEALKNKEAELSTKIDNLKIDKEKFAAKEKEGGKTIREAKKEIRAARKELNSPTLPHSLQAHYRVLKDLETLDNLPPAQKETLTLFRKLMAMQLEVKDFPASDKMERGQELLSWSLLNDRLGVVMAINCKSGLDRTGFFHAAIGALMEVSESKEVFDIVNNWDGLTKQLNDLYRQHDYHTEGVLGLINHFKTEGNEEQKKNAHHLEIVFTMRQHVLDHMLNVSLPITGHSTGLVGLKWGKGMQENLIPLNFIPPIVKVVGKESVLVPELEEVEEGTEREEKVVVKETRIIDYTSNGKPKGLTKQGHNLLTQLSPKRGA